MRLHIFYIIHKYLNSNRFSSKLTLIENGKKWHKNTKDTLKDIQIKIETTKETLSAPEKFENFNFKDFFRIKKKKKEKKRRKKRCRSTCCRR